MNAEYKEFLEVIGALSRLVVLSIIVERALAVLFELRIVDVILKKPGPEGKEHGKVVLVSRVAPWFSGTVKGLFTLVVCGLITFYFRVDIMKDLFLRPQPDWFGMLITAFVLAGGSAGAIAIFQGYLNWGKEGRDALIEAKKSR